MAVKLFLVAKRAPVAGVDIPGLHPRAPQLGEGGLAQVDVRPGMAINGHHHVLQARLHERLGHFRADFEMGRGDARADGGAKVPTRQPKPPP